MPAVPLGAPAGARWVGALLIVVPVALLVLACHQGVGLDWDAVVYLSAADSFAETGRLIDFRGTELTTFAPGFPTLVGFLLRTGVDFNHIGIAIGFASMAIVLVCTYLVARYVCRSAKLSWTAVALVGLSVTTVRVFAMLKTEAPFLALVMLSLVLCLWAIRNRRTPMWWVIGIALTVSAATTFRYIGFTLIPMAALAAFIASRGRSRWRTVASTVTTGMLASAGLMLVSLRNVGLGSAPLGPRSPSGLSARRVLTDLLEVLGSYVLPLREAGTVQLVCGILVVGLIGLGGVAAVRSRSVPGVFLLVFVAGYLGTLVYSEFTTVIQPVNERLLSPVFPVVVVLAIAGLSWLSAPAASPTNDMPHAVTPAVTRALALSLLAITLVASTLSSASFVLRSGQQGIGYNSVASRQSPTANAVRALPDQDGLAAMNGPRVYMATRSGPIAEIPWTNFYSRPDTLERKIKRLTTQVGPGRVGYLVYFDDDKRNKVVTPRQLSDAGLELRLVADYRDGRIWAAIRD